MLAFHLMSERATAITPALLVWARERAGLSVADAAKAIDKSADTLAAWEAGAQAPTFIQLEALANRVYHRPVALFFLPAPPNEPPLKSEFRTLPDADLDTLDPDTRFAIRDAHAYQQSLRELTRGQNPVGHPITQDLQSKRGSTVVELANAVRERLGVTLAMQEGWRTMRDAANGWRAVIERAGVFVFKRSFRQRDISGFCLADSVFPIIVVNNSTTFTRQIFTMLHELAHLIYGVSSITGSDERPFAAAGTPIEAACNRLAAEILLPTRAVRWQDVPGQNLEHGVTEVADRFHVSRELVLRRLLDRELITPDRYARLVHKWNAEVDDDSGSGGNYYATHAAYLGPAFLDLAFGQYRAGNVSLAELAEHLNMKARNVLKLEDYLLSVNRA
jgi:Zn-dependent peptidase ImmA (M78 family)/transcriptional regulator with XRE-family HTH domain